jgi:serine/threonine protein kinase
VKVGDVVGGYLITQPFTNEGGGQSEWTFADKGGTSYFFKRFLRPTFPLPDGPGSERTKQLKRVRCAEFEEHQRSIMALLKPLSSTGGNLVITRDFFRHGAHYCKVTDRVDTTTIPLRTIAALPLRGQINLMVGVAHSLGILHRNGLVHGDIKPDNLLLQQLGPERYATKLIDFDNCFHVDQLPSPNDVIGDLEYYSPELMAYVKGEGAAVSQASDVFALGIVFTQYLTTQKPVFGRAGAPPTLPPLPAESAGARELILSMLDADPTRRPSVEEISTDLKALRKGTVRPPSVSSTGDGSASDWTGVLRGRGLDTTVTPPTLRGKLLEQQAKKKSTD